MHVAFLNHRVELEDLAVERSDQLGDIVDIGDFHAGDVFENGGAAHQRFAEIVFEIELADHQGDLACDLAAVLGQNLQFLFHHVRARTDAANGSSAPETMSRSTTRPSAAPTAAV